MKRFSSTLLVLAAFFAFSMSDVSAQASAGGIKNLPFATGESLVYEAKVSKVIKGITVADLSFNVNKGAGGEYVIEADARSKGTVLKLFRYSFSQNITSVIDKDEFRIAKTVKNDVQKERIRNSEAVFDYKDKRVTYIETDPVEPMRPPRKIASEIENDTHDLISGLYSLRLLPLAVGQTFELAVSDSGLVYNIPVKVTAREKQKSTLGNVWCFRLEPQVFGNGRLIEKEGSMIIWITDDARRLPIRSQVNSPIGRFEIKLKTTKNLKT